MRGPSAAALALGVLLAGVLAGPATVATTSLYERNHAFLLETLPPGAVVEVQRVVEGELVVQGWSRERYASFRAAAAAAAGRDYAAAAEGLPGGPGDTQQAGTLFMDLWGRTTVNLARPDCNPIILPIDVKSPWWASYTDCFVAEHENVCYFGTVCSYTYDWTIDQAGFTHGDSWFGGVGQVINFGYPFGAIVDVNGVEFAESV